MNEQLQSALVVLLTKVTSGMDTATAFLAVELPDVVQQLLRWKLAEHALKSAFCLAVLLLVVWFVRAFLRGYAQGEQGTANFFHDATGYSPVTPQAIISGVLAGVAAFISTLELMDNTLDVVQIWLAPKIFLIEYVSYLTAAKG